MKYEAFAIYIYYTDSCIAFKQVIIKTVYVFQQLTRGYILQVVGALKIVDKLSVNVLRCMEIQTIFYIFLRERYALRYSRTRQFSL